MNNDTLVLRGPFERKSASNPGPPTLPANGVVTSQKLLELHDQVVDAAEYWKSLDLGIDPLVCALYTRVAAKSNRITKLLTANSEDASDYIVGAKFDKTLGEDRPRHLITYCVKEQALSKTAELLERCSSFIESELDGSINSTQLKEITDNGFAYGNPGMPKTTFAKVVRDSFFIERFFVNKEASAVQDDSFVTLYKTGVETGVLLSKLGIDIPQERIIGTNVLLYPDQYEILREKAPFLIAMSLSNLADYGPGDDGEDPSDDPSPFPSIPHPSGEPIVGVIDTVFGENAYFAEWVEAVDYVDASVPMSKGIEHGTMVSSIIVDGPALNPWLEDGCGRFRVKHFGVSKGGKLSSFQLMRDINGIVRSNAYIKVWNLSLGTPTESPEFAVSPVAAMLDQLQHECDVIFIVAGTNAQAGAKQSRIGAPADSINSIVVNAVDRRGKPADYSRKGPVLDFFHKPDVAYYGGTKAEPLRAAAPCSIEDAAGTSFAAPWITRKIAYLVYRANRTKEEAKALLIDAAFGWGEEPLSLVKGYGVPPIRINDIIESPHDEIRFIISGTLDAYETYNHDIPIPCPDGKYPFKARATLCYFPECKRNQGVDYTSTEVDLHFGRLKKQKNGMGISSLDKNIQGDEGALLYEEDARGLYRKWDNVKHITDLPKSRFAPRKMLCEKPDWGVMLRKKERSNQSAKAGEGMAFSVVVTLKEMFGKNRLDEFVYRCSFEQWLVSRINTHVINELNAAAEVDIEFDE